jgi:uncharacterized protein (DUF1800 family)
VEYRDRFLNLYTMAATPAAVDAARFLTQATFGPQQPRRDRERAEEGLCRLDRRAGRAPGGLAHRVPQRRARATQRGYVYDEDAYEAIWQQWLFGEDQLRARMSFALSEIFVISNVAPDLDRGPCPRTWTCSTATPSATTARSSRT